MNNEEKEVVIVKHARVRNWTLTINNPYFNSTRYFDLKETAVTPEYTENLKLIEEIENEVNNFELENISITQEDFTELLTDFDFWNYKHSYYSDETFIDYCKNLSNLQYLVFQQEIGKYGTSHLQAYIEFEDSIRFNKIKEYFPSAHIEVRKGTKKQNYTYCTKAETRRPGFNFHEIGKLKEERSRADIDDVVDLIKGGATDLEIFESNPRSYVRFKTHFQKIRDMLTAQNFRNLSAESYRKLKVIYIYGASRVGKSRYVFSQHEDGNLFSVSFYDNTAFDDYIGQNAILFDEFYSSFEFRYFLKLLDGYRLKLRARYENKEANYDLVYIVSNTALERQYPRIQENELQAWLAFSKRINEYYYVDEKGQLINLHERLEKIQSGRIPLSDYYEQKEQMQLKELPDEDLEELFGYGDKKK